MQKKEYSLEVGGKTLTAQFTNLADQAHGSVIVRYGNTTILATAVMGREADKGYFPLSVEFEEKFYAAGAILGSQFRRREGMPSEEAVLSARVVDRTIRPLFSQSLRRDIQVIVTVLSIDTEDPDVLGVIGASLALGTSKIPWDGPVSAVRIGRATKTSPFIINPSYAERAQEPFDLDVLACGKDGLVNMIEVGAHEVPEEELTHALNEATKVHAQLQAWQEAIIKEIGVPKTVLTNTETSASVQALFAEHIEPQMFAYVFEKNAAYELKDAWMKVAKEHLTEASDIRMADDYFEARVDALVHTEALQNGRRQDGRKMDELRPLYAQAGGISDIIHGTGIFFRGGTHVLSALTLGGPGDAQTLDTIEFQETKKRYMHHYNFPPFSVGETGRVGGFNRRQVGHGALAEKALVPVLPHKNDFPYTIRIVSETLASNGSSSMASVCGSTLALMDAGVPIKKPVAGIAMGMMSDTEGNYKILTDIQGPEDHFGDMDFKVAGTHDGVTAVQMDVKVGGVPVAVLAEGLLQAKKARLQILEVMHNAIGAPRADINPRAPKIITVTVGVDQIGLVIGPGGKTINGIKDRTLVEEITIEDDGTVYITGKNGSAEAAEKEIRELTHIPQPGERYEGEVTRLMDFGAFVKITSHAEGLVHVSEIAPFRIAQVGDAVTIGERVPVIIKEIDERGRINLSIKQADPDFASRKGLTPSSTPHHDRPDHRNNSGERRPRF